MAEVYTPCMEFQKCYIAYHVCKVNKDTEKCILIIIMYLSPIGVQDFKHPVNHYDHFCEEPHLVCPEFKHLAEAIISGI